MQSWGKHRLAVGSKIPKFIELVEINAKRWMLLALVDLNLGFQLLDELEDQQRLCVELFHFLVKLDPHCNGFVGVDKPLGRGFLQE